MNPGAKPKIVVLWRKYMGAKKGAQMLVATPEIVRDYIKAIPKGETRTVPEMRQDLAKTHKTAITCPTSSGMFVRINAEAALEDLKDGKPIGKVTPFWRLVDPASPAGQKISCGPAFIEERRKAESK